MPYTQNGTVTPIIDATVNGTQNEVLGTFPPNRAGVILQFPQGAQSPVITPSGDLPRDRRRVYNCSFQFFWRQSVLYETQILYTLQHWILSPDIMRSLFEASQNDQAQVLPNQLSARVVAPIGTQVKVWAWGPNWTGYS